MKSIQAFIVMATIGLFMSGCASTAHIEKDDAVNFNRYKTFTWLNESEDSTGLKKNSLQQTTLRKAVNAELAKANWREDKENPDVILKHDVLVEKSIKENNNPVYSRGFTRGFYNPYTRRISYIYYPSQFIGYSSDQYASREGTLTITMIDAKTDKVIWQGWTTEEVDNKNLTKKEIEGSVKTIFKKFDPAKS